MISQDVPIPEYYLLSIKIGKHNIKVVDIVGICAVVLWGSIT